MFAAVLAVGLASCASLPRLPYSETEAAHAEIAGLDGVRSWADAPDPAFMARTRAALAKSAGRPVEYLALSGGGGDGAFGAGLLNGWSETGTRPDFTIVSGVSTGALIAPFAFLGPAYDPVIKDLYTSGIAETLLESPDPVSAIFGASVFSNDRLRQLVSRFVTPELVARIGAERARGRLLLVVTTNLDSQRPVLWDMGAIAAENSPRALALFRDVLVASASIPAVFPPMLIDVEAGGRHFQELHVDGTVTSTVFTLPRTYLARAEALRRRPRGTLYVLMNNKLQPDFTVVGNRAVGIGARTFATFVKDQARSDLQRTYDVTQRAGIAFRVAYIERDVPTTSGAGFDTAYMRRLYAYGYEKGRSGSVWRTTLPDAAARVAAR